MTFDEFLKFYETLCKQGGETIPTLSIIKDIFDFIDIRKDGVIDEKEWMNTFKLIEVRNFIMNFPNFQRQIFKSKKRSSRQRIFQENIRIKIKLRTQDQVHRKMD